MEIVTEPDIDSPELAKAFLEELRNVMRYTGVSRADMEKGQLRCDINVSMRPKGSNTLGTRVEVKNVNSFRFVQSAIEAEIQRQIKVLSSGGTVVQETRTFDPSTGLTYTMRTKEEAEDYRYFPDPDLLPLILDESWINEIKQNMPELPKQRLERLMQKYGLSQYEAQILTSHKEVGDFFEESLKYYSQDPKATCNWLLNDLLGLLNENKKSIEESSVSPKDLSDLVKLIKEGTLSSKLAKEVLKEMFFSGKSASQVVEEKGLKQISDEGALEEFINQVIEKHASEVQRYKAGEEKVFGFLVGQVMKLAKGKANPQMVNKMLREKLKS